MLIVGDLLQKPHSIDPWTDIPLPRILDSKLLTAHHERQPLLYCEELAPLGKTLQILCFY